MDIEEASAELQELLATRIDGWESLVDEGDWHAGSVRTFVFELVAALHEEEVQFAFGAVKPTVWGEEADWEGSITLFTPTAVVLATKATEERSRVTVRPRRPLVSLRVDRAPRPGNKISARRVAFFAEYEWGSVTFSSESLDERFVDTGRALYSALRKDLSRSQR